MKKRIVWLLVGCLMVAALLVASCAPAEVEEEVVTPEEEEEVVAEEEVVVTEEKEMVPDSLGRLVEKPRYGGVLIRTGSASHFDEGFGTPYGWTVGDLTNEELLTGDWMKGPAGTDEVSWHGTSYFNLDYVTGSLAESWELTDSDTLVFHLRKGVHFHDKPPVNGREMTADDVVFTIDRLFYDCPQAYLIKIIKERPESITALDKWTVEIKCLPGEVGTMLQMVGDAVRIIPREMVETYGDMQDWRNSCGTGPFELVDYVPMSSLTLVRNPNYWMTDPLHPENQLPYVDGVKVLEIADLSTRLAALRTGKIDYLGSVSLEDAEDLLRTNPELKSVKTLGTGNSIYLIYHRVDKPELPFQDIQVRRALQMAVDNQLIADTFYGEAEVLAWPIAPCKEFADIYTPLEELPESTRELYEYHPDKAKELLADAGYPDGFQTEVLCTASWVDLFSIYKDYWAKIGVDLTIKVAESGAYVGAIFGKTHKEMIICVEGIYAPFKLQNLRPGNLSNLSMVDDEHINQTFTEMSAAYFDTPTRNQLMKEVALYIQSQSWVIQPPLPYEYTLWEPWIRGYHGETAPGQYNMYLWPKYVWLDLDLKEEMTGGR